MTATAAAAAAQTTAEGVAAFERGEFTRAAAILTPIVERPGRPDRVAEYYLAVMYQNGQGVSADEVRACALFMRAASDYTSSLGRKATAAAGGLVRGLGRERLEECTSLSWFGFAHRFQPVAFALDGGDSIAFDVRSTTIRRGADEKSARGLLPPNVNAVFHSIRHTTLDVSAPAPARRHFIEAFVWTPAGPNYDAWALHWQLFEVVRDEFIGIGAGVVATVDGPEPPDATAFDASRTARVFVNGRGRAEWETVGPTKRERGVIQTGGERQALEAQARARSEALARIDWSRTVDVRRAPVLQYADGDGCGRIFLYGWSDDRTEIIAVQADEQALRLRVGGQSFDIDRQGAAFDIRVHVYQRPNHGSSFCNDVGQPTVEESVWRAVRGRVTVELFPPGEDPRMPFKYRATIRIEDAEFIDANGARVKQSRPVVLTALVGWFVG